MRNYEDAFFAQYNKRFIQIQFKYPQQQHPFNSYRHKIFVPSSTSTVHDQVMHEFLPRDAL